MWIWLGFVSVAVKVSRLITRLADHVNIASNVSLPAGVLFLPKHRFGRVKLRRLRDYRRVVS